MGGWVTCFIQATSRRQQQQCSSCYYGPWLQSVRSMLNCWAATFSTLAHLLSAWSAWSLLQKHCRRPTDIIQLIHDGELNKWRFHTYIKTCQRSFFHTATHGCNSYRFVTGSIFIQPGDLVISCLVPKGEKCPPAWKKWKSRHGRWWQVLAAAALSWLNKKKNS